jgi:hypothetical protein
MPVTGVRQATGMDRPPWRPRCLASPDSSASLLQALARALAARGFPGLGLPRGLQPLLPALNLLAKPLRERGYGRVGWVSAVPPKRLDRVSAERVARWMTGQYEWQRYPAVAIGASRVKPSSTDRMM